MSGETGEPQPEPEWFDLPALGQITINTPHDAALFKHINDGIDYRGKIRPGGFLTTAHPHPLEEPGLLIAPKTNHQKALTIDTWANRNTGASGFTIRTDRPGYVIEGSVAVLDYRHYALQYVTHPEWKTSQPHARGVLTPFSVNAGPIERIGKEGSLVDNLPVTPARLCRGCATHLSGRQIAWCSDVCRKRSTRN